MTRERLGPILQGLALLVLVLAVYAPTLRAGFVWDDEFIVTANPLLHSWAGLRRIWLEVGAHRQYYPLSLSVHWLQFQLWGLDPMGYHASNVLAHGLAALLLWRVLAVLAVPGAWLAAALFALHPVQVETVAWVTEFKNSLCGVFYFAAFLALAPTLGVEPQGGTLEGSKAGTKGPGPSLWPRRVVGFLLFCMAVLAKTVACTFPAAALLVIWWRRGRLVGRDVAWLAPFFVFGVGLGLLTAVMEAGGTVRASGLIFDQGFPQRLLVAGRAVWFYAGKLLWPAGIVFQYPKWTVNVGTWWQWLYPAGVLAVTLALWAARRRVGRGPLCGVLFFVGTLFPALGFFDVYWMTYSWVQDHFQYLAMPGLAALAAAGLWKMLWLAKAAGLFGTTTPPANREGVSRLPVSGRIVAAALAGVALLALGLESWALTRNYADRPTLYRSIIARNPGSFMAHYNLGTELTAAGKVQEALPHLRRALEINPANHKAPNAIVIGSGPVQARDLFREGVRLNLAAAVLITLFTLTLGRWVLPM